MFLGRTKKMVCTFCWRFVYCVVCGFCHLWKLNVINSGNITLKIQVIFLLLATIVLFDLYYTLLQGSANVGKSAFISALLSMPFLSLIFVSYKSQKKDICFVSIYVLPPSQNTSHSGIQNLSQKTSHFTLFRKCMCM